MKKIVFSLLGFNPGGLERVVSELATQWSKYSGVECHIITLTQNSSFYYIPDSVVIHKPDFDIKGFNKSHAVYKLFWYFRREVKIIRPQIMITFGGEFNAFFVLSCLGLKFYKYCCERARPGISYGRIQNLLNPYIYKIISGVVVQTDMAKVHLAKITNQTNIAVIPNPIRHIKGSLNPSSKIILNVGRFTRTKNQNELIQIFRRMNSVGWKLSFLGDGPYLEGLRKNNKSENIIFHGNIKEIDKYYLDSSIFAFTSLSEGFPNALAEAMAAGCACISYDCVAGPSDMIDDEINGFLIPVGDEKQYKEKLQLLMKNEELRSRFGAAAREKMKEFEASKIAKRFFEFIMGSLE